MKLRYTGSGPVTFADPIVGEVFPGQEFVVPDEGTAGYLTRSDIEQVEEAEEPVPPAPKPARAKKEPEAPEVAENVG